MAGSGSGRGDAVGDGYRCETCGEPATQYDYDQHAHFCDGCVQQPDFTLPLSSFPSSAPPARGSR